MSPIKSRKHLVRPTFPAMAPGLLTTALLGSLTLVPAHAATSANTSSADAALIAQARNLPHVQVHGSAGVDYRIDINTLHRDPGAETLELNDIGRVRLRTAAPVLVDQYELNRETGSFILVDESTLRTVGAGIVTAARD